ncbi:MAG: 30S ribosomal protein S6e [Methanomicrobiales archaeon]|nr:30S ribosomal protein S6e [Methanomicrobiales archaeon]MDI6876144.1 30S ribosomal protein S6e [Methanomicrobiales archaeon]
MAEFKIVVSDPRTGRAYNLNVSGGQAGIFIGRRIGDEIDMTPLGMPGYSLKITGGTDRIGTPARRDLPGMARRRVLLAGGVGYHPQNEGVRRRKTVRGNEINADFVQINARIEKFGEKALDTYFGKAEEAKEGTAA